MAGKCDSRSADAGLMRRNVVNTKTDANHVSGWRPFLGHVLDVEAVRIHHFGPGCDKVMDELFAVVILCVDLGVSTQD